MFDYLLRRKIDFKNFPTSDVKLIGLYFAGPKFTSLRKNKKKEEANENQI